MTTVHLAYIVRFFAFTLFMRDPELADKVKHGNFTEDAFIIFPDRNDIISQIKTLSRHCPQAGEKKIIKVRKQPNLYFFQ